MNETDVIDAESVRRSPSIVRMADDDRYSSAHLDCRTSLRLELASNHRLVHTGSHGKRLLKTRPVDLTD